MNTQEKGKKSLLVYSQRNPKNICLNKYFDNKKNLLMYTLTRKRHNMSSVFHSFKIIYIILVDEIISFLCYQGILAALKKKRNFRKCLLKKKEFD